MSSSCISVVIIGASGFTGLELLRILKGHRGVEVRAITSRQFAERPLGEVFPSLRGQYDGLVFTEPEDAAALGGDVFFCCLPHGASMEVVAGLIEAGKKVIDLSADFRLKDADTYAKWYGSHTRAGLLKDAVYGLPELNRDEIRDAALVANPGCYPTGATLAIMPALCAGLVDVDGPIIIDSKSGVSGAGRGLAEGTTFVNVAGGFKAYKVGAHRHTPEIEANLRSIAKAGVSIVFTPHLLPVSRGILTTLYAGLTKGVTTKDLLKVYDEAYGDEPFVRVLPEGEFPNINAVRASNYCDIGVYADPATGRMIAISAIDNLVKGASGQAVQNMNIAFGLDETTALTAPPLGI